MLKRKDLTTPEQTAAVIYTVIIYCFEHIHINIRKVYILEQLYPFVCLIKTPANAERYLVLTDTFRLLTLFIAEMIGIAYLGIIVHILRPQLDFRVAP